MSFQRLPSLKIPAALIVYVVDHAVFIYGHNAAVNYGKTRAGNKLIEFSNLRARNFQKLPVLLQPNCQCLELQSLLKEITGVIGVHPELSAALM